MKPPHTSSDRRKFLKTGGALAAGLLANGTVLASTHDSTLPPLPSNPKTLDAMPTRNLGKTGYKVGIFSLGGQAALEKPNNFDVAVPLIERALDLGVNYIDTSSIYGGPERWSEQYVGRVMKTRRQDAFLATKTKERTRDGSLRMIERSLTLLEYRSCGPVAIARHWFARGRECGLCPRAEQWRRCCRCRNRRWCAFSACYC